MQLPLDRLHEMIEQLPQDVKEFVVWWGCLSLGVKQKRTDVEYSIRTKMGELYHRFTVEDLCQRVSDLIEEIGMMEEFVIPALLFHCHSIAEQSGDASKNSEVIDNNLRKREQLQALLKVPVDDRPVPINDDAIQKMLTFIEESLVGLSGNTERAAEAADILRDRWNKAFPDSYWREWNSYLLRNMREGETEHEQ